MAKLIFGCGYLGRRVARRWLAQGETAWAVTRSAERGRELEREGIRAVVGDLVGGEAWSLPAGVETILFAVGYDRSSGHTMHEVYVQGLAKAIDAAPDSVARFIYVSSTGVYGQVTGEMVDEESPCSPVREGGRACLAAERLLLESKFGERAIILRLAGLYGPGRIPRARELMAGEPIDAPGNGWLNLIHVEDAAGIVLAAEERAPLPRTFVVSDGQPVERAEYFRELARLLGAPAPTFGQSAADAPVAARAGSDKRVNPARLFAELEPTLIYPSYRQGLAAIVAER